MVGKETCLFHVRFFRTHILVGVLWYYFLVAFWSFGAQPQRIKFSQVIRFCMEQGYTSMDPWRLGSCRAEQLRWCLRFQGDRNADYSWHERPVSDGVWCCRDDEGVREQCSTVYAMRVIDPVKL